MHEIRSSAQDVFKAVQDLSNRVYKNDATQEKVTFNGIPINLEWLKGQQRQYKNQPAGIVPWTLAAHYGYIRGTDSEDGEELDVYLKPDSQEKTVFLIVQLYKQSGTYDELKYMLGFRSAIEAQEAYIESTQREMFGGIFPVEWEKFADEVVRFHKK